MITGRKALLATATVAAVACGIWVVSHLGWIAAAVLAVGTLLGFSRLRRQAAGR